MQATDAAVSASSSRSSEPALDPHQAALQRKLKLVVIGLGVLLLAGLSTVIGRVIYLASSAPAQPAAEARNIAPEQRLALPPGAVVRSVSVSENRLAVHYEVDARAGIAVLDLKSGRTIADVVIEGKLPEASAP